MKRIISVLLILIVLCGCTMLSSYGANESEVNLEPYNVYFVGNYFDGKPPCDADLTNVVYLEGWSGVEKKYEDSAAPQIFTAEIFGKEYSLEYCYSEEVPVLKAHNGCRNFHVYGNPHALEQSDRVYIKVNALTQQVVEWYDKRDTPEKNDLQDHELREKYARAFLEEQIGQELSEQYVYCKRRSRLYRYVDEAREYVYFKVDTYEDGTPCYYSSLRYFSYDGKVAGVAFDEERAEKAITEAIQKLYPGGAEYIPALSDQCLRKLANGQLVYDYYAEIQTADYGERDVCFIIPIE